MDVQTYYTEPARRRITGVVRFAGLLRGVDVWPCHGAMGSGPLIVSAETKASLAGGTESGCEVTSSC